jgi:deoxyribodipyrimidine photolyase
MRKRNTTQFIPKVFTAEGLSSGGIKQPSHCLGHQSLVEVSSNQVYEQFVKFSKSEIQYFRKLEQQRKVSKPEKAPKPRYNENQRSCPKPVHSIESDAYGPPKNWDKNFGTCLQERHPRTSDQRFM